MLGVFHQPLEHFIAVPSVWLRRQRDYTEFIQKGPESMALRFMRQMKARLHEYRLARAERGTGEMPQMVNSLFVIGIAPVA